MLSVPFRAVFSPPASKPSGVLSRDYHPAYWLSRTGCPVLAVPYWLSRVLARPAVL